MKDILLKGQMGAYGKTDEMRLNQVKFIGRKKLYDPIT